MLDRDTVTALGVVLLALQGDDEGARWLLGDREERGLIGALIALIEMFAGDLGKAGVDPVAILKDCALSAYIAEESDFESDAGRDRFVARMLGAAA